MKRRFVFVRLPSDISFTLSIAIVPMWLHLPLHILKPNHQGQSMYGFAIAQTSHSLCVQQEKEEERNAYHR